MFIPSAQNVLSFRRNACSRAGFLLFLLIIAALSAGCKSGTRAAAGERQAQPKKVTAARPQMSDFEQSIFATGSLLADEEAQISLKVSGRLQQINVEIGSCVNQGDVLARVEPQDLQLRLRQAEAAVAQAEARLGIAPGSDLARLAPEQTATARQAQAVLEEARMRRERTQQLHQEGIISRADLDVADSEYRVAEARYQEALEEVLNRRAMVLQRRSEVALARQDLQDAALRAPFTGCVQQRAANVGEFLSEGTPVLTLVRMDPLRLQLRVPERDAAGVKPGQPLRFQVEGDTTEYDAVVKRTSPAINPEGRMVVVEAELKYRPGLRPGAFARARIITGSDSALAVPERALVNFAGISKVVVAESGKAAEREIQVGRRDNGMVEVVSGLKGEDIVILAPQEVKAGDPVEVAAR